LGYEPTFKTEQKDVTTTIPEYTTESTAEIIGRTPYEVPGGGTAYADTVRTVSKTWQSG
jgi:hypothetical protein